MLMNYAEESILSTCEVIIMKAIWEENSNVSLLNLIEILRTKWNRDYARTTVVTFLTKLEAKGFVQTYRNGRNAWVKAVKNEEDYKNKLLREMIELWYGGDVSSLQEKLNTLA